MRQLSTVIRERKEDPSIAPRLLTPFIDLAKPHSSLKLALIEPTHPRSREKKKNGSEPGFHRFYREYFFIIQALYAQLLWEH